MVAGDAGQVAVNYRTGGRAGRQGLSEVGDQLSPLSFGCRRLPFQFKLRLMLVAVGFESAGSQFIDLGFCGVGR
jgi:hypothetical protein